MPGTFAHLTAVTLARDGMERAGVDGAHIFALLQNAHFGDLGAVSPDYPYLAIGNSHAQAWADLMHYQRTGAMIRHGIEELRRVEGAARNKLIAWLLGYTSHVVLDSTIHPVVELKVGPYAENKTHHRVCEMNQDSYIFERLKVGQVGTAEYLKSGIALCVAPGAPARLDSDVAGFWADLLKHLHEEELPQLGAPDPAEWHRGFQKIVDTAEEGYRLFPLARHVAVDVLGLTYPLRDEVDLQYITRLDTPEGPKSYDEIFDRGVRNIVAAWKLVSDGLNGGTEYASKIRDWNLDTGKDLETNQYGYWSVT